MAAAAQSEPVDEPSGLEIFAAMEEAIQSAIVQSEKSVVAIARVRVQPFEQTSAVPSDVDFVPSQFGTGVIIDERGLILTNYHVLGERDGTQYYVTTIDRQRFRAEIKAADPRTDLAVLEVRNAAPSAKFIPIRFGDAKTLKKGSFVVALGNPYAIARDGQPSASFGIISNLLRKVAAEADPLTNQVQKTTLHHFGWLIQTDAKLNLGTSGGALVNLKGEMVGLTTSLAAVAGYEQSAGYAIPVDDTFRYVVGRLKEGREAEHGFLGIQIGDRQDGQGRTLPGAVVMSVVPGTPAFDADVQPRDAITAVNGEAVYDRDHLMLLLGKLPTEAQVRLTIERRGHLEPLERTAVLAKFWVPQKKIVSVKPPSWRGLHVDYTTATPQRDRTIEGQVIVVQVDSDSPAATQRLTPGMIITDVDGTPIRSPKQFRTVVAGRTGEVTLTVRPDSNPFGRSERRTIGP